MCKLDEQAMNVLKGFGVSQADLRKSSVLNRVLAVVDNTPTMQFKAGTKRRLREMARSAPKPQTTATAPEAVAA